MNNPTRLESNSYRQSKPVLEKIMPLATKPNAIMAIAKLEPLLAERMKRKADKLCIDVAIQNERERTIKERWFALIENHGKPEQRIIRYEIISYHLANKRNKVNRQMGINLSWALKEPPPKQKSKQS